MLFQLKIFKNSPSKFNKNKIIYDQFEISNNLLNNFHKGLVINTKVLKVLTYKNLYLFLYLY